MEVDPRSRRHLDLRWVRLKTKRVSLDCILRCINIYDGEFLYSVIVLVEEDFMEMEDKISVVSRLEVRVVSDRQFSEDGNQGTRVVSSFARSSGRIRCLKVLNFKNEMREMEHHEGCKDGAIPNNSVRPTRS